MLQFVLADRQARELAAQRPSSVSKVRGVAVALSADLLKSAWTEAMRVGDRSSDPVRARITQGDPQWHGSAKMSLKDARVASRADQRGVDDSFSVSLGGEDMPVSGKLDVFEDHLVMNVSDVGPMGSFAIRPEGQVMVVGVVAGNPGESALVVTVASGHQIVIRLGRARRLAEVLGTLAPSRPSAQDRPE